MKSNRNAVFAAAPWLAAVVLVIHGPGQCARAQDTNFNFQATNPAAAQKRGADADYELGRRYAIGLGVPQDYIKAVKYLRQSADQGYAPAQTGLGSCYAHGLGVKQDYAAAVEWYRRAAAQGDPLAQYGMGYAYAYGKGVATNFDQAVQWWQKSAEHGQVYAQSALGRLYFQGEGPGDTNHINYAASAKWLRLAAEQGYVPAMNTLGFLYQSGLGVGQEWTEAVRWYRCAAEQGDANAQANLGLMYEDGHGGLPHDKVQAYKWLLLSAAQGNAEGRHDVFEFKSHQSITPEQTAEAERLAAEFRARTNHPAENRN